MNQEIKKISSEELIEELVDRNVLEKIEVGNIQTFQFDSKVWKQGYIRCYFSFS